MLTYEPNIVLSNQEYNIIGKRPIRPDGAEKVTGHANYGADVRLPGMLYGKILRSPHAHARIKSIDTRHAAELPGVYAVVTSADLAQPSGRLVDLAEGMIHNMRFMSNNILAADKVLYKGHAIAAVAATSALHRRGSPGADPGGVRRAAAGDDGRRGDETGRPPAARTARLAVHPGSSWRHAERR